MNKLIRNFVFALLLFVGLICNVNASGLSHSYYDYTTKRPSNIPSSFTMNYAYGSYQGKQVYGNNGQKTYDAHIKYNRNNSKDWVYCIESGKGNITSGTMNFKAVMKDPGLVHILKVAEGYDHSDYWNYYKGQLAIWFYMRDVYGYDSVNTTGNYVNFDMNGGRGAESEAVVKAARKLADEGISIHNSYVEPAFTNLTISNTNLKLENGYLVSEEITVSTKGVSTYSIYITGGEAIDSNGKVIPNGNVKAGTKFRVRTANTTSANIIVEVQIAYEDEYAVIYNNSDSGAQDCVYGYFTEPKTVKKTLTVNYTQEYGTVEVSKVDATTGKELPGATLVIKDSNGKEVAKWVSTNEVHKVTLVPGTYTLCETIAPVGYKLKTTCVTFTVTKNKTTKVKMENEYTTHDVEISKQDATTKAELAGATLVLKDSNGKQIDKWVSTTKPHKVTVLPGTYSLTETIAPEGYVLSTETVTFTVGIDGKVTGSTVMFNKLKDKQYAKISKQDATTKTELPGAHLEVRDLDGKLIESWTSTTTPHEFEIKPGKYVLTETIAPQGYVLSTESITFEVKDGKVVTTVTMYNSRDKVTVEISKQDATTGKELPGATLELRDSNGKLIETWVSTNETHKVKLDAGTYTLTETIAPAGYELSTETVTFTVGTDGKVTGSTVMLNKPIIEVPLTADFVSPIVYIVGSLCVLFGLGMVTLYVKKPSFNK